MIEPNTWQQYHYHTIGFWPNRPSPLYFWSAPDTSEHRYVVDICKASPQTKFEQPQTPSKPVNSFSAVKVTFQFFTRFGMEMSKSDPRIRFLIDFWPKKKKNCTPLCLKLPKLSSKKEIFQLLILFFKIENLSSYCIVLLFCKKPNQTRPKSRGAAKTTLHRAMSYSETVDGQ